MLHTLTLLCILALARPPLDGEGAVTEAKRLLHSLGMSGDLQLQSLSDHNYVTKEKCWSMALSAERGPVYVVLDARTGRALLIQAKPNPEINKAANFPPTPESIRRVNAMLHTLGYDRNVKRTSNGSYQSSLYGASFYLTTHGLQFFNLNPTYAHRLTFEPGSGAINYFLASKALPPTKSWKPTVDPNTAVKKIDTWVREQAKKKGRPLFLSLKDLKAELGYWKFENEPAARLVWRASHYTISHGLPSGGGCYRMFVDAITGDFIEPDDPLWGPNP